ncbi:hypothetical protein F2Q69_00058922 [Brassica cretica]|uniref:Uncharacterized protein n=1 Tax=Brassica cretica TaxID=69181 RepID=A0A8S9RBH3_BRACR|nr:hypothetical protein F2Q69_00058922 [Brassica cretica]
MSTHTLHAQGRRSTVALPEKIKHTGSAVLVQREKILLHTPEVQRSLARQTEELANIREPPCFRRVYPKILGSKRKSSTNSGVLGDKAQKPPCFRRINSRTSGPQEDISVIDGFREDTSNMTEWKDLRPAKSTRNCRTTRPTKVQQDQNMKPLRALDSREESLGTKSSYTMYVDTSGYYVPPRSCARKKDLAYHCNANPRSRIPASERGNRSPTADSNRYKFLSISGKSTLLQVQTWPMPKKNPNKEISKRRPVHVKPKGPATDKPMLMPTEASNVEIMSTHTLHAQGRRSTVALPGIKHTGSAVLVQREKILLHTPEVQRSLARQTEELANIREPPCFRRVYPKILGSKRKSSTNSGFLGDKAQKPPCFRRINSRTSGPQEDISVIDGFQEDTSNMTKWKDLRPAKSTRNCRTTRPTKVLLPRTCPIVF